MSKSLGNVIDPFNLIDLYGIDQFRFFFLREVPFGKDGNYSHEAIVTRINADLANDLGNLAQRSLSMIVKNCDGLVPVPWDLSEADQVILAEAGTMLIKARTAIDRQAIHLALEAIWDVVSGANKYFAGEEPWALKKTDPARMGTVLYVTAELIRQIAIMTQAFMPDSSGKMLDLLKIPDDKRDFASLDGTSRLTPGTALEKPEPIFPRYVEPEEEGA